MKKASESAELADLPNLGKQALRLLTSVGISSPEELRRVGAVAVACRIRALRPADPPCRSLVAALEGAIRGVRWHLIPKAEREQLWQAYLRRPD